MKRVLHHYVIMITAGLWQRRKIVEYSESTVSISHEGASSQPDSSRPSVLP